MIHPDCVLQYINDEIGYGVFARRFIPKGTIVYVKDLLEIVISQDSHLHADAFYKEIIEKYSYISAQGDYIISWDFGRYVNHSCQPNTLSTGYGFEIATRNILAGEQITDDYGLFNLTAPMNCGCGTESCRGQITEQDMHEYHTIWDKQVRAALTQVNNVEQPLMHLLDRETYNQLLTFLNTNEQYLSVLRLASKPHVQSRMLKTH